MVEIAASARKKGRGVLVPSLLPVLLTHNSQATSITKVVIILEHKLPNLRRAEVSLFLYVLLISSVVALIGDSVGKVEISTLSKIR